MVEPRPSATTVIARDSEAGPEFLFVRRRAGDAFGESYTFPGGVLDADEQAAVALCSGMTSAEANACLDLDSGGLDYFSAAVRETFEETGVLIGANGPVDEAYRAKVDDGSMPWPDLLGQLGVLIPCNDLHYFAHWITPTALPKRWTTRFFLTRMPAGQKATPDGTEVTDIQWLTGAEALSGSWRLPYPTRKTIASMADPDSVDALIEWARRCQESGVTAIQPEMRAEDGKRRVFMPDIED